MKFKVFAGNIYCGLLEVFKTSIKIDPPLKGTIHTFINLQGNPEYNRFGLDLPYRVTQFKKLRLQRVA